MRYRLLISLALCLGTQNILAQETTVNATVVYVAGPNFYLSAGRAAGIAPGDTLRVERSGESLGSWVVISSSSRRSVVKSAAGYELQVGSEVQLILPQPAIPIDRGIDAIVDAAEEREQVSIMKSNTQPVSRQVERPKASLMGRVSLNIGGNRSTTTSLIDASASRQRITAIPSISVLLRGRDLPGGVTFRINTRAYYRYTDQNTFANPASIRLYDARVERQFSSSGLVVSVGRFNSQHERFSGYWDGFMVRAGRRRTGVGIATGFQPSRLNEGFTADLPKYSAFVNVGFTENRIRYDGSLSFTDIVGQSGYYRHMIAGAEHKIRLGRSRISNELQINRDPIDGAWKFIRVRGSANLFFNDHFSASVGHDRYRSFSVWSSSVIPADMRIRSTVGLSVRGARQFVSLSTTRSQYGNQEPFLSVAASGRLRRLPGNLDIGSYASYWQQTNFSGMSVSTDVGTTVKSVNLRLRYRFSHSGLNGIGTNSHTVTNSLIYRQSRRLSFTIQATILTGSVMTNYSLFSGLSVSF
ncbi:MAG: hypothetical protein HKN43_02315 [Rhodothermales bacterium]|nr:hypothetical protein [Rhodothermales bacterium]